MRNLFCLIIISIVCSCHHKNECKIIGVDANKLDSAKGKSDTNYVRKYRNEDFATAEYFINRKDTTICQVMKDASGQSRQVIMARKETRFFIAEYFANGQLKAALPLNQEGNYDGESIFYYETGCIKSRGLYKNGFFDGEWKNYAEGGKLISKDWYDSSGQLIKSESYK